MSKQPLPVPPGALIFKDLVFRGFWQSRWYAEKTRAERETLIADLVHLISQGKVCFTILLWERIFIHNLAQGSSTRHYNNRWLR